MPGTAYATTPAKIAGGRVFSKMGKFVRLVPAPAAKIRSCASLRVVQKALKILSKILDFQEFPEFLDFQNSLEFQPILQIVENEDLLGSFD